MIWISVNCDRFIQNLLLLPESSTIRWCLFRGSLRPIAHSGRFILRDFHFGKISRQLCVDSRSPGSWWTALLAKLSALWTSAAAGRYSLKKAVVIFRGIGRSTPTPSVSSQESGHLRTLTNAGMFQNRTVLYDCTVLHSYHYQQRSG